MSLNIQKTIHQFVDKAVQLKVLDPLDRHYTVNRLLAILNLKEAGLPEAAQTDVSLLEYMDKLVQYAKDKRIIDVTQSETEMLEARIMDLITPLPSSLNQKFWDKYQANPEQATDYFYELSQQNDYIKTRNIAKNIIFTGQSEYGDLEVTINLSKPEKDPKEITKALTQESVDYPKCVLCMENEGYEGHANHAARQNHRIIRIDLPEETYGFQYSPYVYYNEHSIFLNETHMPMAVDRKCFNNILEIVKVLPHYFVGSNADLPRVGGSILAHDHYQGGRHVFPMEKAKGFKTVQLNKFDQVEAELVYWPMSVIRLRSNKAEDLVEASTFILDQWMAYSDEDLDIIAYTNEERHNTITPIARFKDGKFEMDLVLRNNRASEDYPDGIFHPHQDVHHIKKENIGLIEVMGLAVLPPRLVTELETVKAYLLGKGTIEEVTPVHQEWAVEMASNTEAITEATIQSVIEENMSLKFARVLEDAGVFKQTDEGRAGFIRFIDALNQV